MPGSSQIVCLCSLPDLFLARGFFMFDRQIGDPDHVRHLPKLTPPPRFSFPFWQAKKPIPLFLFPPTKRFHQLGCKARFFRFTDPFSPTMKREFLPRQHQRPRVFFSDFPSHLPKPTFFANPQRPENFTKCGDLEVTEFKELAEPWASTSLGV